MGTRRVARIVAFQGLYAWEEAKSCLEDLQTFAWLDEDISDESRVFAGLIIAGTLEHQMEVDEQIKSHLKRWTFDRLAKVDLAILRTSVYSLMHQKDIPASVTIDEAVEISKKFASKDSYRFINGILDGIRKSILS